MPKSGGSSASRAETSDTAADSILPMNLLPGVQWDSLRDILMKVHDLGLETKPLVADIRERQTSIAAYLALGYREIRSNPRIDKEFHDFLANQIKGNDPVRKFVKFALREAQAGNSTALKGFQDMTIAAVHIALKEFMSDPAVEITFETVREFINSRKSAGGQTGLEACWCIFMDMQRAAARASRELAAQKDALWAREAERRQREEDRRQADFLGITVAQYKAKQQAEDDAKREADRLEALAKIRNALIRKSVPIQENIKLLVGRMLIVDDGGNLRVLPPEIENDLLVEKVGMAPIPA